MSERPHLPVAEQWFSVDRVTERLGLITEPHVGEFLAANLWYLRGRDRDLLIDAGNGVAPLRPYIEGLPGASREVVCVATHAHADHIGGFHEFDDRRLHRLEVAGVERVARMRPLLWSSWADLVGDDDDLDDEELDDIDADATDEDVGDNEPGGRSDDDVPPELLLSALPSAGFDPHAFRIEPAVATMLVADGDTIDLGDRRLRVIELPGHTPGSIGLIDDDERALYSGDAIYDGGLLDTLPESNVARYLDTVERLRDLPVEVVYPGHGEPFGRDRLRQLSSAYLRLRG